LNRAVIQLLRLEKPAIRACAANDKPHLLAAPRTSAPIPIFSLIHIDTLVHVAAGEMDADKPALALFFLFRHGSPFSLEPLAYSCE